jgi:hypothetical protein
MAILPDSQENDMTAIHLGNKVEDIVTGLTGIVTSYVDRTIMCRRWHVQPHSTKVEDAAEIDELSLVFIADGIADKAVPPVPNDFQLKEILRDKFSKIQGEATARMVSLNGCVYYMIQEEGVDDKGAPKPAYWINVHHLERVSEPPTVTEEVSKKDTGGPMTQAIRL